MLMQDDSCLCKIIQVYKSDSSFCKKIQVSARGQNFVRLSRIDWFFKNMEGFARIFSFLWLEKSQILKIDDKGQTYMKISKEWPRHHFCRFFLTFFFHAVACGSKRWCYIYTQKKLRTSVVRKNGLALNFVQCQKWWEK